MRNSAKVLFSLALICAVVVQGSLIGNLINSTKIKGRGTFDLTNGLSMGYQGGVTFNMNGREFSLIDLGAKFNAVPEVSSLKSNTTASVRYSGALSFTEATNTSSTNMSISGTTSLNNDVVSSYDNTSKTTTFVVNQTISDSNTFVVRSGVNTITGKASEGLNSVSTVVQKDSRVKINQNTLLDASVRGIAISNGTSLGAFTATSATTTSTKQDATLHTWSWLPNVTYSGSSKFNNSNYLSFQGTTYNTSRDGSSGFLGFTKIRGGNGSLGVVSEQGLDYSYKTSFAVNNTVTNTSSVYGVGKVHSAVDSNKTVNGTSTGIFTSGNIYQVAHQTDGVNKVNVLRPQKQRHVSTENAEESTELLVRHSVKIRGGKSPRSAPTPTSGSYYSALSAGWKAGALQTTQILTNTSAQTNTTAGWDYKVGGINTRSWKPWSTSGRESVTTSFKTTVLSNKMSAIDNVTVSATSSPFFQKKMADMKVPQVDKKGLYFPEKPRH